MNKIFSHQIYKNIVFGLEFETCVHILDNPLFTEKDDTKMDFIDDERMKNGVAAYYLCLKNRVKNAIDIHLILDAEERNTKYNRWVIMPDIILSCRNKKICIMRGEEKACPDLLFLPVEIISPALRGFVGLKYLTFFWFSYIMADDMIYAMNSTQGMHTNISHKDMDYKKFVKLWLLFEPVIFQIIGESRRKIADEMAEPLHKKFSQNHSVFTKEEKVMNLISSKFLAINVKKGRIEVRVREGTMNYSEIILWTLFCMQLLYISIVANINKLAKNIYKESKEGLLKFFFGLLKDKILVNSLIEKYNKNKENSWPLFQENVQTEDIFEDIIRISREEKKVIDKNKQVKCDKVMKHYMREHQSWKDSEGRYHRDDDLPALIEKDFSKWFKHGVLHRVGGPAIIGKNGYKSWYFEGQLHNDNGPAVIGTNNRYAQYYRHGVMHNEHGPAFIIRNRPEASQWWINGVQVKPF